MPRRSTRFVPDRGNIVWVSFDPQIGHEQAGHRLPLVLTPALYNRVAGLMIACPITRQRKGYPFEVPVPPGTPLQGVFLADQLRSLDWEARDVRPMLTDEGSTLTVAGETMAAVAALLTRLLLD